MFVFFFESNGRTVILSSREIVGRAVQFFLVICEVQQDGKIGVGCRDVVS